MHNKTAFTIHISTVMQSKTPFSLHETSVMYNKTQFPLHENGDLLLVLPLESKHRKLRAGDWIRISTVLRFA